MTASFHTQLRAILDAKGLSPRDLAKKADIAAWYVRDVLAGRHDPIPVMRERLASALAVSPASFEEWVASPVPGSAGITEVPAHVPARSPDQGFGAWLKATREDKGLSQRVLAERMGSTPEKIRVYERGQRRPQAATIARIAAALETAAPTPDGLRQQEPRQRQKIRGPHRPKGGSGFGAWLKEQRFAKGWRGGDLAQRAGINPSILSQFETGRRLPSEAVVVALATALGIAPDDILAAIARGRIEERKRDRADATPPRAGSEIVPNPAIDRRRRLRRLAVSPGSPAAVEPPRVFSPATPKVATPRRPRLPGVRSTVSSADLYAARDLGAFLRAYRGEQRLSIKRLARLGGIDHRTLQQIEEGIIVVPARQTLECLARLIDSQASPS